MLILSLRLVSAVSMATPTHLPQKKKTVKKLFEANKTKKLKMEININKI